MRPEVLLLDCGGTLTWPPFERVRRLIKELRGIDVPTDNPFEGFYRSSHALEMYLRQHGRPPAEDMRGLQHWLYLAGFRLTGNDGVWTEECTDELLRREGGRMGKWDHTFPWVEQTLRELRLAGLPLAVVSNSDRSVTELLQEIGYAPYLDVIVDSFVDGVAKPDARLFYLALERLGRRDLVEQAQASARGEAEPPPVVHIGDHYRADFQGAWEAGLNAWLLDPLDLYDDIAPNLRVKSIADLPVRLKP
ncbi:HAD hydrolase-like protein [bacterium]|nr:HAD hydrolase-like protein [bacterium]